MLNSSINGINNAEVSKIYFYDKTSRWISDVSKCADILIISFKI